MDVVDFFIGLSLMNAMPHYVLGVWKAKMLSGFGIGHGKNIIWGIVNLIISISLFAYKYGLENIVNHGIYLGALTVLIIFFISSHFWYNRFYNNKSNSNN